MCRLAAITLTILKWLGILLLVIIGIVLAAAVCILFVPVRYHIYIEKQGQLIVRGCASWLLHFFHLSFQVKGGEKSHVSRILGIPLKKRKKTRKGRRRHAVRRAGNRGKGKENRKKLEISQAEWEDTRKKPEISQAEREDTRKKPEISRAEREDTQKKSEISQARNNKFFHRLQEFFLRIRRILGKIKKGMEAFLKFLMEGPDWESDSTVRKVTAILSDDNTLQLWKLVWRNLSSLWRHSKPRKLEGWVHFGTSDPCTTGQILGAVGAGYALLGNHVRVVPDFEHAVFEGCLEMKGRIRVVRLLVVLGRVFFSSQWKHFKSQMG